MISSYHGWYNRVLYCIGTVSSVAEFIEEIKRSFITELVEFRSRFSNFSRVVLANRSLVSGSFKQFTLTCFFGDIAAHFTYLATLMQGVQMRAISNR